VVGTCSGDSLSLAFGGDGFSELSVSKNAIVQLIFLNSAVITLTIMFIVLFALKSLNSIG